MSKVVVIATLMGDNKRFHNICHSVAVLLLNVRRHERECKNQWRLHTNHWFICHQTIAFYSLIKIKNHFALMKSRLQLVQKYTGISPIIEVTMSTWKVYIAFCTVYPWSVYNSVGCLYVFVTKIITDNYSLANRYWMIWTFTHCCSLMKCSLLYLFKILLKFINKLINLWAIIWFAQSLT